jgi:hypothetical protein
MNVSFASAYARRDGNNIEICITLCRLVGRYTLTFLSVAEITIFCNYVEVIRNIILEMAETVRFYSFDHV